MAWSDHTHCHVCQKVLLRDMTLGGASTGHAGLTEMLPMLRSLPISPEPPITPLHCTVEVTHGSKMDGGLPDHLRTKAASLRTGRLTAVVLNACRVHAAGESRCDAQPGTRTLHYSPNLQAHAHAYTGTHLWPWQNYQVHSNCQWQHDCRCCCTPNCLDAVVLGHGGHQIHNGVRGHLDSSNSTANSVERFVCFWGGG